MYINSIYNITTPVVIASAPLFVLLRRSFSLLVLGHLGHLGHLGRSLSSKLLRHLKNRGGDVKIFANEKKFIVDKVTKPLNSRAIIVVRKSRFRDGLEATLAIRPPLCPARLKFVITFLLIDYIILINPSRFNRKFQAKDYINAKFKNASSRNPFLTDLCEFEIMSYLLIRLSTFSKLLL